MHRSVPISSYVQFWYVQLTSTSIFDDIFDFKSGRLDPEQLEERRQTLDIFMQQPWHTMSTITQQKIETFVTRGNDCITVTSEILEDEQESALSGSFRRVSAMFNTKDDNDGEGTEGGEESTKEKPLVVAKQKGQEEQEQKGPEEQKQKGQEEEEEQEGDQEAEQEPELLRRVSEFIMGSFGSKEDQAGELEDSSKSESTDDLAGNQPGTLFPTKLCSKIMFFSTQVRTPLLQRRMIKEAV